jgi:hypothetical protein
LIKQAILKKNAVLIQNSGTKNLSMDKIDFVHVLVGSNNNIFEEVCFTPVASKMTQNYLK